MFDWTKVFDPERVGIAKTAGKTPDHTAFCVENDTVSYGRLEREINAVANAMLTLGMKPGDNIAALFHNSYEVYLVWAAAAKIKATSLAVNFKLKESELAYILDDSGCKLLIYHYDFQELIDSLRPMLTKAEPLMVHAGGEAVTDGHRLEELLSQNPTEPPPVQEVLGMVPPSLAYTSGTTGKPKGVYRTGTKRFEYLLWQADLCGARYDDVHLVAGPVYHAAPFAWGAFSLLLGNKVVIMPRFDAETFLKLVSEHRVGTTFMVPTMMRRLMNLPDEVRRKYDISSLRSITIAGEPFPYAIKKRCIEYFGEGKLFEFYGGTEIGVVTHLKPADQLTKAGSCGQTLEDIDILVLDEKRREVPVGEVGVFFVKSPFLLDGYHNNPEATAANFHNDYFTVGDMGYVDEEGYYYLVDRAVDMIISGGVNIYPAEIEEVLYQHGDIQAATVIGVPDPAWGERVVAFVVQRPGTDLDAEQVIAHVDKNLAAYKKPKEVIFLHELPVSTTGKVLKRELRKRYIDETK